MQESHPTESGAADDSRIAQALRKNGSLPDIFTEEERNIIELLVGLRGGRKHSCEEIALLLNKEKGRVNQIRWRVVRKLNHMAFICRKKGILNSVDKKELREMFAEQDEREAQASTSDKSSDLQKVIRQYVAPFDDEDDDNNGSDLPPSADLLHGEEEALSPQGLNTSMKSPSLA